MDMQMNKGLHIVGKFVGTVKKPWANDDSRFNHNVGIIMREWEDDFGDTQSTTVNVEMPYQEEERVTEACKQFSKGDLVMVNVNPRYVEKAQAIFYRMVKGSEVRLISKAKAGKAAA